MLKTLVEALRNSLGVLHKQDIQTAADSLGQWVKGAKGEEIRLGDDCAAIPDGDGFLLLASEGIWPRLVEESPWFAGWCAVMVNVSDVAAMGGRPVAVVDALWSKSVGESGLIWEGMMAAAKAYGVPIVGGHTNCHSPYAGLSVAILGRAERLITSFDARRGDVLMIVVDMVGEYYQDYPFWDAATRADSQVLRGRLELLPRVAGVVAAGKDISMGGIVGTLLMLAEGSGCGAVLDLGRVPCPQNVEWQKWLTSFPSFGFLLSVQAENVGQVKKIFQSQELACQVVGEITDGTEVFLRNGTEYEKFWDFERPLTGFGGKRQG